MDILNLAGTLEAGVKFAGLDMTNVEPVNTEQTWLTQNAADLLAQLRQGRGATQREAHASPSADDLNKILEGWGLTIRLDPWPNDGKGMGMVGRGKFAVVWETPGMTDDEYEGKILVRDMPAFRMTKGVRVFSSGAHDNPIFKVPTLGGGYVGVTHHASIQGVSMVQRVLDLESSMKPDEYFGFAGLDMRMLDARITAKLAWMLGLQYGDWIVRQALLELIFQMNQYGVRGESGVAMSADRSMAMPYQLSQDHLLWVMTGPGQKHADMILHVTDEICKDPGSIEGVNPQ
jgi:hypothetical protein